MFGLDPPQDWAALIVFVVLGVVCFASLGVALSHAIPNFDSAPAYVNAAFLPLIFISGVFYDADDAPGFLRGIAEALPLKHLIDGLSGAIVTGDGLAGHGPALLVLALWSAVGIVLAVRGFSWDARRMTSPKASARNAARGSTQRAAAPRQSIASGAPIARPTPARLKRPSTIARCGGLASQPSSTARGTPRPPQPHAIVSAAEAPLQPAA